MGPVRDGVKPRIGGDVRKQADVGIELDHALEGLLGVAEHDRDAHARKCLLEGRDDLGRVEGADRRKPQGSDLEPPVGAEHLLRLLAQAHESAGHGEQRGAGLRQLDPPAAAGEELDLVSRLEFLDLRRHRGLADAEHLGGGREPALLRDRVEGAQQRE